MAAANERERALLKPFPARCAPTSWTAPICLPATDATGRDRETLRGALALLADAGYEVDGNVLRKKATGDPSPSRSWPPRATRSASRSPMRAT